MFGFVDNTVQIAAQRARPGTHAAQRFQIGRIGHVSGLRPPPQDPFVQDPVEKLADHPSHSSPIYVL